jgi:hypothetical protein
VFEKEATSSHSFSKKKGGVLPSMPDNGLRKGVRRSHVRKHVQVNLSNKVESIEIYCILLIEKETTFCWSSYCEYSHSKKKTLKTEK